MSVLKEKWPGHVTTGEAARYLGVSQTTVNDWCAAETIDFEVSDGGWRMIPISELKRKQIELRVRRGRRKKAV